MYETSSVEIVITPRKTDLFSEGSSNARQENTISLLALFQNFGARVRQHNEQIRGGDEARRRGYPVILSCAVTVRCIICSSISIGISIPLNRFMLAIFKALRRATHFSRFGISM